MKKTSIKDNLLKEIKRHSYMKTSSVIRWGINNHTNTAERKARLLCEEGKIERMDKKTSLRLFGKMKEKIWVPVCTGRLVKKGEQCKKMK